MRIIISPAKKMNVDTDSLEWRDLPAFLPRTELLLARLQSMSYAELKKLWGCNDGIAQLNFERLGRMRLRDALTPAILSYEGIQYQYMAPGVFTDGALEYIQRHLRIISGFYGMLRPFDGVTPYRLEMQAKLKTDTAKDLYGFWGGSIAEALFAETDCVIDLASKEYSSCISKHFRSGVRLISCVFGEEKDGKVTEKGTLCKMARGAMVRFMAENDIQNPEDIKSFDRLNYRYSPEHSNQDKFVFILSGKNPPEEHI